MDGSISKKKRQKYSWGTKDYLLSMKVGEVRVDDGRFNWRYLAQNACQLARYSRMKFSFSSRGGVNTVRRVL